MPAVLKSCSQGSRLRRASSSRRRKGKGWQCHIHLETTTLPLGSYLKKIPVKKSYSPASHGREHLP